MAGVAGFEPTNDGVRVLIKELLSIKAPACIVAGKSGKQRGSFAAYFVVAVKRRKRNIVFARVSIYIMYKSHGVPAARNGDANFGSGIF